MSYIGSKPANKPVVASDIDPTVITGQTALAVAPADTDEFLISDAGVLKRLDASLIGSQDYVKLSSTTPSVGNTISIDGFFTSDYDVYKIYLLGFGFQDSPSGSRIAMRVNIGGSALSGSGKYRHSTFRSQEANSGSTLAQSSADYQLTYFEIGFAHATTSSVYKSDFEITCFRPLDTTAYNNFLWDNFCWNGTETAGNWKGGGSHTDTSGAVSGISIAPYQFGSGNIELDKVVVYGLKI
jgi:hypothetical protein